MPLFLAFVIGIALMQTAFFDQQRTLTGAAAEQNEYDTMRQIERYRWFARAASLKLQNAALPEGQNTSSYDWDDIKHHPALPSFISNSTMPAGWRVKANSQGWVICSDLSETALAYVLAHLPPQARLSERQHPQASSTATQQQSTPTSAMTVLPDPLQADKQAAQTVARLCAPSA
jgi:hypothetical protein